MPPLELATVDQSRAVLSDANVEELRAGLRGALLLPADPGYEESRSVWNAMIDRRPAMIVRCAGVADVVSAIQLARDHRLLVSVRGGGHNVAGNAVCQDGLMIDLSAMRSVQVDPGSRTARVEGGATWLDVDAETQAFGLATTGGLISATGVAGLTLGGGIGWLMGSYGLACDSLLSLDVVTADGGRVTADADSHDELFWGSKGGGGNFGVVTSFEFRLHQVGPELLAGTLLYPLERSIQVLSRFRDFLRGAPDELGALMGFVHAPAGDPAVALVLVYNGPVAEGKAVVQPLRAFGSPIVDDIAPRPYCQIQRMFDAGAPRGLRHYWKSSFLPGLPDDAIEILASQFGKAPSAHCKMFVECIGGEVRRVPAETAAFPHRASPFNLLILSGWELARDDESGTAWARETWRAMQPFSSSAVYVNYLAQNADEGSDRIRAAYGTAQYAQLAALKSRYDPDNLFRMNQNIEPA